MWELVNRTPYAAERGFVRDQDGGEVWIVLAKATFDLHPDGNLQRAAEQPPVDLEPVYRDSPAGLYLRRDTALIPTKPGTEILIEGSACAPRGRSVSAMDIGFRIGPLHKRLHVVGDRRWLYGFSGPVLSKPEPFSRMPIRYERALGGLTGHDPKIAPVPNPYNPVGTGHALRKKQLPGTAAPNIEQPGATASDWARQGPPAGFGPIARHWTPRRELAGTFDDAWSRTRQPLLPEDFDERFYFSAPADQCFKGFLRGGESMTLHGLSPHGDIRFPIPSLPLHCRTSMAGQAQSHTGELHGVLVDTDAMRVACLWHSRLRCHGREHLIERSRLTLEDSS